MSTAYDTAWVARLAALGESMADDALNWLRENQLPDGGWGALQPYYHHDRLVSTLAAVATLNEMGDSSDQRRIQLAKGAVIRALAGLGADPAGETIGFELIMPPLLENARFNGKGVQDKLPDLTYLDEIRQRKLAALPIGKITRDYTMAFSSEMAGSDELRLLDASCLQESNGSVALSPSATAFCALYVSINEAEALNYLRDVVAWQGDGGASPNVSPFDAFECSWVLWNLSLGGDLSDDENKVAAPHLEFLHNHWRHDAGIGFAVEYTPTDSDGTSVTLEVLKRFGRDVSSDPLIPFEGSNCFRCYPLEANPSVSVNIHVLGALRAVDHKMNGAEMKILKFLRSRREADSYWIDKWHASPFYTTSHAVIALVGLEDAMVSAALDWISATQNKDGSWGFYMPTAEETAYALQALCYAKLHGYPIDSESVKNGRDWLLENDNGSYPPLWIGKCLYSPTYVVKSAILSALRMSAI